MKLEQLLSVDRHARTMTLRGFPYTFLANIPLGMTSQEVNAEIETILTFFKQHNQIDSMKPEGDFAWGRTAHQCSFSIKDPNIAMLFKLRYG